MTLHHPASEDRAFRQMWLPLQLLRRGLKAVQIAKNGTLTQSSAVPTRQRIQRQLCQPSSAAPRATKLRPRVPTGRLIRRERKVWNVHFGLDATANESLLLAQFPLLHGIQAALRQVHLAVKCLYTIKCCGMPTCMWASLQLFSSSVECGKTW